MAHHKKHHKGEDEEPRKPEQMPCIFKVTHQALSKATSTGGFARLFHAIWDISRSNDRMHSVAWPYVRGITSRRDVGRNNVTTRGKNHGL
jgi:hypothetical protein